MILVVSVSSQLPILARADAGSGVGVSRPRSDAARRPGRGGRERDNRQRGRGPHAVPTDVTDTPASEVPLGGTARARRAGPRQGQSPQMVPSAGDISGNTHWARSYCVVQVLGGPASSHGDGCDLLVRRPLGRSEAVSDQSGHAVDLVAIVRGASASLPRCPAGWLPAWLPAGSSILESPGCERASPHPGRIAWWPALWLGLSWARSSWLVRPA